MWERRAVAFVWQDATRRTHLAKAVTASSIMNRMVLSEAMDLWMTTRNMSMLLIHRDILNSRTTRTSRSTRIIRTFSMFKADATYWR